VATRYTFGDSHLAARRLATVAEVFAPTSRALLARAVPAGAGTVVDLGCGPGHTSALIAEVCRPRRVLGLDASAAFVAAARRRWADRPGGDPDGFGVSHTALAGPGTPERPTAVDFAVHDVTALPLPGGPADAIHARLLLAHLADPLDVVAAWRTQLVPDGVLVLDEVERIDPPPGLLADYVDLVVAVVASGGARMYAGPLLAPLGGATVDLPVDGAMAARMFGPNLATWRSAASERGLATDAKLDRLGGGLADLAERPGATTVGWVLRQLALPAA
jgi:SAM-dependent methyltransferase